MTTPPEPFDPKAPKTPAPPLYARAPRPSAVRIRKPVIQAAVGLAALLVSGSLAWAFIVEPDLRDRAREAARAERPEEGRGTVRPSERITTRPSSYDRLGASELPAPRNAMEHPPAQSSPAPPPTRVSSPDYARPSGSRPAAQAAASGLFFAGQPTPPGADQTILEPAAGGSRRSTRDLGGIYSAHQLLPPVSPYELKAGALIPGVLLTAVDTSRPGPVVATVSQNVFDSITGRYLLIPQGARLIGRHEGDSAYGDRRAFLVWDRMILPNGNSLLLAEEPGVDAAGAVGVEGRVDRRLTSLAVATLFSGAITTLGELARSGAPARGFAASAGDAASIQASEVGGRLVDRELTVRPAIQVRAGTSVRVMITRDLILEPYRP